MPGNTCRRAPRVVPSMDIRALPIGPEEAFVLSRIDGISSEEDIASATGFDGQSIQRIINRLSELGAIEFELPGTPVERVAQKSVNISGSFRMSPVLEIQQPGRSQHPGATDGEPANIHNSSNISSEYLSSAKSDIACTPSGEFALTRRIVRSTPSDSSSTEDSAIRRRALARKLGHSSAPPSRSTPAGSPSDSGQHFALNNPSRQMEVASMARRQQVDRYLSMANEAAECNNLMSAVNSLKIACSLCPQDRDLARKLEDMQLRAASALWQEYAERADYEVFEGRLAEAVRSYEVAALGHPSWRFFERAAFCCLNSGGDLKKAAELAKRAVSMAPENPKCRLTLAQVYVAAKLKQSAISELERVLELDPKQDSIREYIRSVKRDEI